MVDAVDGSSAYLGAYNKLSQRTLRGCQCKDFFSYTAENGSTVTSMVGGLAMRSAAHAVLQAPR